MAKIGSAICACLLVFMVVFSGTQEVMASASVVEEKRSCESQSHRFKGKCLSDHNCGSVCNTEGFPGGKCRGFRQRCFCTRPC